MNIAALCTAYWPASHADVIVSRWLKPFPGDERWGWQPTTRIASLHIAQRQANDGAHLLDVPPAERGFSRGIEIGVPTALRHGVRLFDSIRGALTLGGAELAADGVLLIGEHGDYPHNTLGQHLYPRKEMFDVIVSVFKQCGRCVPVFVDKHLSWNGAWAREMVHTAHGMGFALMAGSSLPYTLSVAREVPAGARISEAVALFHGGIEAYGFHSLEMAQCVLERRAGGEQGVRAITMSTGERVREAMAEADFPSALFDAALATVENARPGDMWDNLSADAPALIAIERVDGLREWHVYLDGHISDFALAVHTAEGAIHASRWAAGDAHSFYHHFAALNSVIERMFLTGRAQVPLQRTLLTTLMIERVMHALADPGVRIETPDLHISYSQVE
jgi:hypothetical protein